MAILTVGSVMPDFTYDTPYESGLKISQTAEKVSGKTAVVFLRYYGCTLCQYDIHSFAENYDAIKATGGQLLVVLQSKPAGIAEQLNQGDLPFDIICDPEMSLYKEFEINPAESQAKMVGVKTLAKLAKVTASGYKHGEYEGDELQLPAAFVIDSKLTISYAHYGKTVDDVPSADELAKLLS